MKKVTKTKLLTDLETKKNMVKQLVEKTKKEIKDLQNKLAGLKTKKKEFDNWKSEVEGLEIELESEKCEDE